MRLGKWTLAFAAVALFCGTAMAQVDDYNRLCMHNGSDYYIIGYDHNQPNVGVGKYYPSFTHRPADGIKDSGSQWYWPWKIYGWAWTGMQASAYGPTWVWPTHLMATEDNPWNTSMTFKYNTLMCQNIVPHTGPPWPVYGTSSAPSMAPGYFGNYREMIFPSTYGGYNAYLNLFAYGTGSWSIASTAPYYGWQFALSGSNYITLGSQYSVWQYAYEQAGPNGQYALLSGNETDNLGLGGGKGRVYSLLNQTGGWFGYWANNCTGHDSSWAMCLLVDDAICIPTNVPGVGSLGNPYAVYSFDISVATVTPNNQGGGHFMQAMFEDYKTPGKIRGLLAGLMFPGSMATVYGPAGNRVPHPVDFLTNIFIGLDPFFRATPLAGYPAQMFGPTTGAHTIQLPFPPDPGLKCLDIMFSGFGSGIPPTAGFMATFF